MTFVCRPFRSPSHAGFGPRQRGSTRPPTKADVDADWHWLAREYPRLDRDACLADMHVITSRGRVLHGFDRYRSMARVIPLARLVLPLLYIPGVANLGRRAYRSIASRRTTSACAVPLTSPHA